jgi:hypothetical protein
MPQNPYPFWSKDELSARRLEARKNFKATWQPAVQQQAFDALEAECEKEVRALMDKSDNLLTLLRDPDFFDTGTRKQQKDAIAPARFMTRPFLSEDNLEVLAEDGKVADVVVQFINQRRFPWLMQKRAPTPAELHDAVAATAELMAIQRSGTSARMTAAKRQEEAAKKTLTHASVGFTYVDKRTLAKRIKEIKPNYNANRGIEPHNLARLLSPKEFTSEFKIAGAKCDLPIVLSSGLLLLLECKVSGSEVNSVKRLIRETVGKRRAWRDAFGQGAMTGAVIAGNFYLSTLEDAQEADMLLFFEHEMDALAEFARKGVPRKKP